MTDDLLDEATRLAAEFNRQFPITAATLRALVERVQEAEAARQEWADLWQKASMSVLTLQDDAETLTRERDEARAKLDEWLKVLPAITPAEFPAWRSGYAPKGEVTRVGSELGKARAKLDKVRALVTNPPVFGDLAPARWYGYADMRRDVLAILDGKDTK
jgi:hypothetical protein